jgi:hypothetical protein
MFSLDITMSARRSPNLQALYVELLKEQQVQLRILRERHWAWVEDAEDYEASRTHREIADLIRITAERYDYLLEALQERQDKD